MQGVNITPFRSYFNSRLGEKELFFRSKNDPKLGVKLGVKGHPVPKMFTPLSEL